MRVLHAYNQHRGGGGADNAARATIEVSRRHGLEVEVFTRDSEGLAPGLRGRIEAGASVVYAPSSVRAFRRRLDSFRPDVVHLHEVFPLVSPWILPECTRRGIPAVMTCVDYRLTCPVVTHLRGGRICTLCAGGREHWALVHNCRERLSESLAVAFYGALTRKLGLFHRHVSRFVAPSEFTRGWLADHAGIPRDRIATISPVVEIPAAAVDPDAGEYVAYAGRLTPEKGVETLVEAARISGLPFVIARHERSLVSLDVPPEVRVVSTRTREDLDAFYRRARVLVVPSIWFETFGLVAAEAMSHGVPVVASRIGALACLVEDGVDGLLFEPRDAVDLCDKVRRVWGDAALGRRLGAAGRRKARDLWSAERHFERLTELYDSVRRVS